MVVDRLRRCCRPVHVAALVWCIVAASGWHSNVCGQTVGPLRVNPANPRYFTDGSGKAILLAGSHTWHSIFEQGGSNPPPMFDITQFCNFLKQYGHNFTRTFVWEQSRRGTWTSDVNYWFKPGPPYKRTGPGNASDGELKFNLDSLDQTYFDWIKARVDTFAARGIYVSIQLFDGWSVSSRGLQGNPWLDHPMRSTNNVNGIDGGASDGMATHSLSISAIWPIQERYIKHLIDVLDDYDNVLWEVSNESSYPGSNLWEARIIDTIRAYESRKPKQHPIGFTADWNAPILNGTVFASRADWVSPAAGNNGDIWKTDPPDSGGRKVVINDTDHLWGNGGDAVWVWKSFCRGTNVLYMDGYDGKAYGTGHPWTRADSANPTVVELRKNLGYILRYANRMNLVAMAPRGVLASTGYCLANPVAIGAEFLVYFPSGGANTVNLSGASGVLNVEWFNPSTGDTISGGTTTGNATKSFTPPFNGDAVLYLYQREATNVGGNSLHRPQQLVLEPIYPNPFNDSALLRFYLPDYGRVELVIYDILGAAVLRVEKGGLSSGWHQIPLHVGELPSGVFYYRFVFNNSQTLTGKVVHVR